MTLMDVLMDFSYLSILMILGYWLRRKMKLLQIWFIPAALIAGALGLLLGPQVLGKISPIYFSYSDSLDQWANVLSCIVFSCSFLGQKLEKTTGGAVQTYFLAGTVHQMQVVAGLSIAFLLSFVIPGIPVGFGILPVLGFYGGHGLAIPAGQIFDDAGYMTGGSDVAATFATIGILSGIIGGMIIINRAAREGKTTIGMKPDEMPRNELIGYDEPDDRKPIGRGVSVSSALDPLASQLMMVGFTIICGYLIRNVCLRISDFWSKVPLFAFCLMFSLVFTLLTNKNKRVMDMMDRPTINRISGAALEYMIVANLCLTNTSIFVTWGIPMLIESLAMILVTYWLCFALGKVILHRNGQFETGIGLFGQSCGNLQTGLMLLKVVDPDAKTNGAINITTSSTLGYSFQLQYTVIFMTLVMSRPLFTYAYSWLLLALLCGLGIFFGRRAHAKGE